MSKIRTYNGCISFDFTKPHFVINAGRFALPQPHIHATRTLDYHTILFVEYGQWDICINGADFTMHAGDTVILPAGILHYGKKPCLAGTRGYYVHISRQDNDSFATPSPFALPCVISSQNDPRIHRIFNSLAQQSTSQAPYAKRLCSSLFDSLLVSLQELSLASKSSLIPLLDSIFDKNKSLILTNKQVASQAHYSQKALERTFRAETGKSLHQYQLEYKLNQAMDMIRFYPEITLTEVALMLGFYDTAHFSKVFKKQYGIPPHHYTK